MLGNINKSVLKYLIYSVVILAIFYLLPKNKLSPSEFILVFLPIIGLYIIIDLATCSKSNNVIVKRSEKFEPFQNKSQSKKSSNSTTKKSPRAILSSLKKKTPKTQSKKLAKIAKKLSPKKIARLAKKLTPKRLGKIAKNLTPRKMAKVSNVARKITSIKSPKSKLSKKLSKVAKLTPRRLAKAAKKLSPRKLSKLAKKISPKKMSKVIRVGKKMMKPKLSKKQQVSILRESLFKHINAKFPNLSMREKVKKMIELTKDKKYMKQLYIKRVHSPRLSPRKLAKKISPRKLAKKISPRKLSKKISPRKLSKKISPRKLSKKISPRKLSKKISPRKLAKKISPRKLSKKISPRKLSKKMSPRKLSKKLSKSSRKVSKKLSKSSRKLAKSAKSKLSKKLSKKRVEKFTNLPPDLERELNAALSKSVDVVSAEVEKETPVSTPKTTTPVTPKTTTPVTPRTTTPVTTPKTTTPITSRASTPVTTPKVTTPNTMQKAVRTAVSAAVKQAMTKTPNMSAQRIIRDLPTARVGKLLETRGDVAVMEKEYKRKIRDLERRLAEKDDSSDWKYNQFNIKNMKPLGDGLQSWENDYVLLNTDKWAPSFNPPPVCKTEKSCPVCPNMSAGYAKHYTTLKDFNSTRKVMGPDSINLSFINKLNSGK